MMRITADQILKPGAVLDVRKIDFSDAQIQDFVKQAIREQKRILSYLPENWTQKQWQSLRNVITI